MKLYYHKTTGGAEYLFDTFIECDNGHKEGTINNKTKYVVRIDGDITKDAEIQVNDTAGLNFSKKELEFLSDTILDRMTDLGRINSSSKEMRKVIEKDLKRLEAINTVICSEITRISS